MIPCDFKAFGNALRLLHFLIYAVPTSVIALIIYLIFF